MKGPSSFKIRHFVFLSALFLIMAGNHIYYRYLSAYVSAWPIIAFDVLGMALWLTALHKWLSKSHKDFVKTVIESSSKSCDPEKFKKSMSPYVYPSEMVSSIVENNRSQEKKQQALMEDLRNSNTLLEQTRRITDSIMHITSEILSSGEIDKVLQTILDKAIEIIPHAQKGSILLYNGSNLEYIAAHGYNFEVLKNLKLSVDQIFQHDSDSFYEPCIISNPQDFNEEHLELEKFEMLKEGKGFELKSILSCAIQVDNEFYGIINLDNADDENAFTIEDKPLIKHLATQTGIALKNARLIERILYLSRHDSLTGIYNRCHFEEILMRTFQLSKASANAFSLAILDINELKSVNDTYGHEAGDLLLKRFVQGMNEHLTNDDIFSRYGGDEFAIIFTGKSKTQAEKAIKNIKLVFSEVPFTYCGKVVANINFGCGIAEFPAEAQELDEMIKLADTRMYKNKRKIKKPIR